MYKYVWFFFFSYIFYILIVFSISFVDEVYFKNGRKEGKKINVIIRRCNYFFDCKNI